MPKKLLLQTALLLMVAQAALGAVGYGLSRMPWVGLVITLVWLWFLIRVALVLRGEMDRLLVRRRPVVHGRVALAAAAIWQIPTYLTLPFWAPARFTAIWEGALAPAVTLSARWAPGLASDPGRWLWAAFAVNVLIFGLVAGRSQAVVKLKPASRPSAASASVPLRQASGDWVAARRRPAGASRKPIVLPDRDEE